MSEVGVLLVILAHFGLVLGGWAWLGFRVRRRGAPSGAVVGVFDEIYHPSAQRSRAVIEVQDERMMPPATPGDPKNQP